MSSILKVDTIQDQSGNNIINESGNVITIGASGDTITVPAGATVSGFTSAGIDDNATSTAITISSDEDVTFTEDIKLGDGKKAIFGAGSDFEILHNSVTGNLFNLAANPLEIHQVGTNSVLQLYRDPGNGVIAQFYGGTTQAGSINTDTVSSSPSLEISAVGAFAIRTNNGSERMRILSDGKVGIGTASPATNLEIRTTASDNGILIKSTGNTGSALDFDANRTGALNGIGTLRAQWNGNGVSAIYLNAGSDTTNKDDGIITFNTRSSGTGVNPPERMRISSTGNLFIATTTESSDDVGHALLASGSAYHTADGTYAGLFNRKSSDGEIVQIRRNNTLVGSLDTVGVSSSGRLVVKSTTFDGFLDRAGTTIAKWMQSSFTPGADNNFDLGRTDERWQDIYLSGGAFIGGTGTANKLDDFEEGTWTPIYRCTGNQLGSVTYNSLTGGEYTKVGQLVTCTGAIASNAVTLGSPSGNLRLGGLPFTVKTVGSTTATRGGVAMSNQLNWSLNNTPNNAYVVEGTTEIDLKILYGSNDDAVAVSSTDILTGSNTGANRLFFTLSYMTDA